MIPTTPHAGGADQLRRAMATIEVTGGVSHFYDKLVEDMVERGYRLRQKTQCALR